MAVGHCNRRCDTIRPMSITPTQSLSSPEQDGHEGGYAPVPPAEPAAPGAAFSPLYRQIKALIVQSLDRGEWKPGEAIPSELDLASRFKVSQGTVRKALDELAADMRSAGVL